MKHVAVIASVLLLSAGCASAPEPNISKPQLELVQLAGPADIGYAIGPTQIQYELHVTNTAAEPITVRRIEIASIGTGSYQLRRESLPFNQTIAPNTTGAVQFWAHAYAFATDYAHTPSNEPVTLRAIIYFESPSGEFHQIMQKFLPQFRGSNG